MSNHSGINTRQVHDAAKQAFAGFMAEKNLRGNQIEFINLIIDHLTERGAMDPRRLYESPFTDFDDQGVSGLFHQADVQRIVQVLHNVCERSVA
jgi:type I restriction enzyme R subunit